MWNGVLFIINSVNSRLPATLSEGMTNGQERVVWPIGVAGFVDVVVLN